MEKIIELNSTNDIIVIFKKFYKEIISAQTTSISLNPLYEFTTRELNLFSLSYNYSLSILNNDKDIIDKEIKNINIDYDNNAGFTENYYFDFNTLNVIRFNNIKKIKRKWHYSLLRNVNTYGFCYYVDIYNNDGIKQRILNFSLRLSSIDPLPVYEIIEEKLKKENVN